MDYTDFGPDGRHNYKRDYKINRPLTDEEKNAQLHQKRQTSDAPLDWFSVIKLNSTYMELIDRWYPIKGTATWQAGAVFLLGAVPAIATFIISWNKDEIPIKVFGFFAALIFCGISWIGYKGMRFDIFRSTHYPIRLNRKNRMVYVTRPRDTVLTVPWDDLFFCVKKNDLAMLTDSVDVRAHVLGEDGVTVKDTFTLAYPFLGDERGLKQLWEFVRRYMEEPDGVEKSYNQVTLCMPVDGRREGVAFGLLRTFAPYAKWPAAQLVAAALGVLFTVGRWIAMYTSKIPVWPKEVETACPIEPNDPYQKDWHDNGSYGFWELGWPTICFIVGLGVIVLIGYLVYAYGMN